MSEYPPATMKSLTYMFWKFTPIAKNTIWGGHRLGSFVGLDCEAIGDARIGEIWEVSDVPGSESVVSEGPDNGLNLTQLIQKYGAQLLGDANFERYGDEFPLLIKFIDADDDLSVQVHPDDAMAHRLGKPNGKSEMWYVVDATPGAQLALGFEKPVTDGKLIELAKSGEIVKWLRYVDVKPGDAFMIPAGRVHAIGKGCMVLEVQQTSDDTYRLYDYHRKDANGKERELHLDLANEATDCNDVNGEKILYDHSDDVANLVKSELFTVNIMRPAEPISLKLGRLDSFSTYTVAEGAVEIEDETGKVMLHQGESLLVAASTDEIRIYPQDKCTIISSNCPAE